MFVEIKLSLILDPFEFNVSTENRNQILNTVIFSISKNPRINFYGTYNEWPRNEVVGDIVLPLSIIP